MSVRVKELEELRKKSVADLDGMLVDLRKDQFKLRARRVLGELQSSADLPNMKRKIARAKTIMVEKKEETRGNSSE